MKLLSLPASLVAVSALHAQTVLTVASDGSAAFSSIRSAIAVAPEGATILVRAGLYNEGGVLELVDRSLVLCADVGASVSLLNCTLSVSDLAPGKTVVLRGLTFLPSPLTEGLVVEDCQGTVWIEDTTFVDSGFPLVGGQAALRAVDSVLVLSRTTIVGIHSIFPVAPATGLRASGSTLHLFETHVTGGRGGQDQVSSGPGGIGVFLEGGFLFAASSTIQGGQGGMAGTFLFGCTGQTSGRGGRGLVLDDGAQAHLLGTTLAGGAGGVALGSCSVGPAGNPVQILNGTLEAPAWPAHGLDVTSPVRAGEVATATFRGVPGELAWYVYSDASEVLFLPQVLGTLVLDHPLFVVPVGVLDAQGEAEVGLAPPLAPGVESARYLLQSFFFDGASGAFTLSTPAALVVLADGF